MESSDDALALQLDRLLGGGDRLATAEGGIRRVGRFVIEQAIGYGAFGIVYRAHDPELERSVAIKLPRLEVLLDAERRGRFLAEAQVTASFEHPGIVPVYEASLDGPTPYIVSQLIEGPDLAQWLEEQSDPVPWRAAVRLVASLARAIGYAHSLGVSHRDLKPSNVLLQPRDETEPDQLDSYEARVTDFGLAKAALPDKIVTKTSLVLGTPLYMAPEQLVPAGSQSGNAPHPEAADIYSLGVILFELLSGQPPHHRASYSELLYAVQHASRPHLPIAERTYPQSLAFICQKCLERDPESRYDTAEELAADLEACEAGKPIAAVGVSFLHRLSYWTKQPRRIVDAGRFLTLTAIGFLLWMAACLIAATFWHAMTRSDYLAIMGDFAIVIMFVYLPMLLVGWQTTEGKPWAIKVGCLFTALNCFPPLLPLITGPMLFKELYANDKTYLVFTVHLFIGLPVLVAFLLYLVAWRAMSLNRNA